MDLHSQEYSMELHINVIETHNVDNNSISLSTMISIVFLNLACAGQLSQRRLV